MRKRFSKIKKIFNTFVTDILGLLEEKVNFGNDLTNEVMELILRLRENAKSTKDFETADIIREELKKMNIEVKDGRDSSAWQFND
jgi:cysteinyl-tRNA synthetase